VALLELNDVHTYYGSIHALRGISLSVEDGEIVTLIGSNGAGKSTTLRTISGLLRPRQGTVMLEGKRLDGLRPHQIVELGVCQSPEGRRVFARMSVQENLEMGAFSRRDHAKIVDDYERIYDLFPRLRERRSQKAGTLSGGEQQMLAIGRALMSAPRVLLLDEPSMGRSTSRARPYFWSSRTPSWRSVSRIAATSCRRARSSSPTSRHGSPRTPRSRRPTSAPDR